MLDTHSAVDRGLTRALLVALTILLPSEFVHQVGFARAVQAQDGQHHPGCVMPYRICRASGLITSCSSMSSMRHMGPGMAISETMSAMLLSLQDKRRDGQQFLVSKLSQT